MALPLFTAYADGSITGKPSPYTSSYNYETKEEVIWDSKTIRAVRQKNGTLKITLKKQKK